MEPPVYRLGIKPMLSDQAIREYQEIAQNTQGRVLTLEEAQIEAEALIRLYEGVFKVGEPP